MLATPVDLWDNVSSSTGVSLMPTKSYPFIHAWGAMLNSMQYYIVDQIELAQQDNAPEEAIYRNNNGTWSTLKNVKGRGCRQQLRRWVKENC